MSSHTIKVLPKRGWKNTCGSAAPQSWLRGVMSGLWLPTCGRRPVCSHRAGERSVLGRGTSPQCASQDEQTQVGSFRHRKKCFCLQRLELHRACVYLLQDGVFQADRAWPGGDLFLPAERIPSAPQRPPSLHCKSPHRAAGAADWSLTYQTLGFISVWRWQAVSQGRTVSLAGACLFLDLRCKSFLTC